MRIPAPTEPLSVNLYDDLTNPTPADYALDFSLERVASEVVGQLALLAAYALGAREAFMSVTFNYDNCLDPDAGDWYEAGRKHYNGTDENFDAEWNASDGQGG